MPADERRRKVEEILEAVWEQDPATRPAFLDEACGADNSLRKEVESLLAHDAKAGSFLETPALHVIPTLAIAPPPERAVGNVFGHFKIIREIGRGGMGIVFLANDLRLDRDVALKLLPEQFTTDRERVGRFEQEARAASKLSHPNILTIYEVGQAEQTHYIATEYVDGLTLRQRIKGSRLHLREAIDAAGQIASGLEAAHAVGILHRDIKPENIMIRTRDGAVKVLDFGVAKLIEPESGDTSAPTELKTRSGVLIGTPNYMSPEQIRGIRLDQRSDIFSFGILLSEVLTGRSPFSGTNQYEMMASILNESAVDLEWASDLIPGAIRKVIGRCLEKDRNRRYLSFSEVRRDLEAFERESTRASDPGIGAPAGIKSLDDLRDRQGTLELPTILVLPLEAMGSGEQNTSIGIGLAHAIMTDLAKISGLSVVSKSAATGNHDHIALGANDLARHLGAGMLLEGEVLRAGDKIGVMVRLTDARTGRVIWGSQFRGDASDLFGIQDAVCEGVAAALKVSPTNQAARQVTRPTPASIDAFEFYSKGRAFLDRSDVTENIDFSIQMFEQSLRLQKDLALSHAGLAEALWVKYKSTRDVRWVDRAIAAADRALTIDPGQAQVHVALGVIYHGTGKAERAIQELNRAIELQPTSDDAYRCLGRCYSQKGQLGQAIDCYTRAIRIRPGYWETYNLLGNCYYTFGRYREAAEQYRCVITIQPDNYNGYNNLGSMYYLLGHYEDAAAMHRRAFEIYPSAASQTNLGADYFYLSRYAEAIEAFEGAIRLDPTNDFLHVNLGDALARVGKEKEAHQAFGIAIQLLAEQLEVNPDNAELLARLAVCQAKLQRAKEAADNIERAISLEPHNTTVMYQRAVVYALTARADEAIEYLATALAHGYSASEAKRDPDLDSIRDCPAYGTILLDTK